MSPILQAWFLYSVNIYKYDIWNSYSTRFWHYFRAWNYRMINICRLSWLIFCWQCHTSGVVLFLLMWWRSLMRTTLTILCHGILFCAMQCPGIYFILCQYIKTRPRSNTDLAARDFISTAWKPKTRLRSNIAYMMGILSINIYYLVGQALWDVHAFAFYRRLART